MISGPKQSHIFTGPCRTRRIASSTALVLLLAAAPSEAAFGTETESDSPPKPLPLSLEQALERGERESALLTRARAELRIARSRMVGASIALPANPLVSGGFGPRSESSAVFPTQHGLQYWLHAEQMLEVGGQRGTRREVVARGIDVALARERLALAETRARVRGAYMGTLLARAQLDAALRREALVRTLRDAAETRARSGAASDVERNLAILELGRASRDRAGAVLASAEAQALLTLLLGLPAGSQLNLLTDLVAPPVLTDSLPALIEQAQTRRAELAVLASSNDVLDAELKRLRREVIPNPTVFVEVQRDLPGQAFVGGGLALSLPVWRRNQGEIAVTRAERQRNEDERAIEQRRISLEVERAYLALRARLEQAMLLETEVLPAAESAVDLVRQGWQAGKFDLFRVIQASRDAAEAKRTQLENLGELWQAAIELDRATGKQ